MRVFSSNLYPVTSELFCYVWRMNLLFTRQTILSHDFTRQATGVKVRVKVIRNTHAHISSRLSSQRKRRRMLNFPLDIAQHKHSHGIFNYANCSETHHLGKVRPCHPCKCIYICLEILVHVHKKATSYLTLSASRDCDYCAGAHFDRRLDSRAPAIDRLSEMKWGARRRRDASFDVFVRVDPPLLS